MDPFVDFVPTLAKALSDIAEINPTKTTLYQNPMSRAYHVVVVVTTKPATAGDRGLLISAVHIAVRHLFLSSDCVDVNVIVPDPEELHQSVLLPLPSAVSAVSAVPVVPPVAPIADILHEQALSVEDFILKAVRSNAEVTWVRVLEAYPWRDAPRMKQALPELIDRAVRRTAHGEFDPIRLGFVDDLLPIIPPFHREAVHDDVVRHLGRPPKSLLELYETVYTLMQTNDLLVSPGTHALFRATFAV